MQTIGSTFKNIREERKLLLEDVTKKTGINKTLLSRIENGKRLPTREQVTQLGKYYKAEKNNLIVQQVICGRIVLNLYLISKRLNL
mgnify:CR=1 FL=1